MKQTEPYPSSYGVNMPWREAVSGSVQYVRKGRLKGTRRSSCHARGLFPFETEKVERSAFEAFRLVTFWSAIAVQLSDTDIELDLRAGDELTVLVVGVLCTHADPGEQRENGDRRHIWERKQSHWRSCFQKGGYGGSNCPYMRVWRCKALTVS